MLRALLYFFTSSYMPIIFEVSYHVPVLLLHQVCTYDVVIGSRTMHPQLSSARLYIAQQRSAVPCFALLFAVLRRAALCVLLNMRQQLLVVIVVPGMIQIPGLCTCFAYSSFCFLQMIVRYRFMYVLCVLVFMLSPDDCSLSVPMCPPPSANMVRTAVQNVTSTSTQHRAGQLALHKHLLALLSIRYSHQIITGLFFLPHEFTCFS